MASVAPPPDGAAAKPPDPEEVVCFLGRVRRNAYATPSGSNGTGVGVTVGAIAWSERVPQLRDLPTAIHERLSLCKSNTQPLKDSLLHLKGRSFFLADAFVASLSSVHRLRAELRVRPAIHSGWRWTYNLTTSTRPMISSGAGGPCT